jgi:hypothetical protein
MYFFPLDIPPFFKAAPIPLVAIPPPFFFEVKDLGVGEENFKAS